MRTMRSTCRSSRRRTGIRWGTSSTTTRCTTGITLSAVDSNGLSQLGIEHAKDKLVGRGVLLDIARWKGVEALADGNGISNDDLDACAAAQKVEIRKGDFVIVRTGQMEACNSAASGAAMPAATRRASSSRAATGCMTRRWRACAPTPGAWRCGPTRRPTSNQPWHWVVIPAMGLYMGEIFDLKELAEDCAADKVYEFFFCGAPLIIPGGTGSPINPRPSSRPSSRG